jgi:hypothetical protein
MNLFQQMANIGSEVSRALNWQKKNNKNFSRNAAVRALELLDLSLDCAKSFPCIKEFARLREAIVDYFFGVNSFKSSEILWRRYFGCFERAARKGY